MWDNTYQDIKTRLKLKFGFENAKSIQEFENLANVVSSIFGESKKEVKQPENFAQAISAFESVFGRK